MNIPLIFIYFCTCSRELIDILPHFKEEKNCNVGFFTDTLKQALSTYVLKLKTCPNNFAHSFVFEPPNSKLFGKFKLTPPLGLCVLQLF